MTDDFPERESRKRTKTARMQDYENESDDDEDEEEKVSRAPKKPKAKAGPKLSVTSGPRQPFDGSRKPADKGSKDGAKDHRTKEERALLERYTQLRALKDAQANSVGDTNAQSAEQAQNDQRMAAAVAALRQDTQADARKPDCARWLQRKRYRLHRWQERAEP